MTRDDLFGLAKKHGHEKGKALTDPQKRAIENQLAAELQKTPERPMVADGQSLRPMAVDEAVRALMEELTT